MKRPYEKGNRDIKFITIIMLSCVKNDNSQEYKRVVTQFVAATVAQLRKYLSLEQQRCTAIK